MPEADPNQTRAETIEQPAVFRVSVAFRSQAKRQEQHANAYPPSSLLVGRCSIPVMRWHWSASSGCSAVASAIPPLGNRSDTSDPGRFIGSGMVAGGTLNYPGATYRFRLEGLGSAGLEYRHRK